ncbi:hypothetical protein [Arenimonas metalli]|uniref:Uncharacterized protein n=1 Tax=Arenimonas metalli CF5-1 TaxID=1384056 RepID=A0A091BAY4_9GAMM|nr:hypothetical protein [Arenimonas metalli]KFN47959.1 hypothetical protein N787_07120 [Arenimonas metalli CF5-1]
MARLALERAPDTADPGRFLRSVPAWGALAGWMLCVEGAALLASRWSPATVALVHVFTLGVLGNALFGSLLQFLPAAADVPVRGGTRAAVALHAALNVGTAALVAGLCWPSTGLRAAGATALGLAFAGLGLATLPGLLARCRRGLLQAGLSLAVAAGLATAALGVLLVAGMGGGIALSLPRWTDLHAASGVIGWMLALLVTVARVVMPMFQGAPEAPARAQVAWLLGVAAGLPLAGTALIMAGQGLPLRVVVATALVSAASAGLWLQARTRKQAPGPLFAAWRLGFVALGLGAVAVAWPGGKATLAGVLVIAVAFPQIVIAMLLEIDAFLGWITLHRRCGRGLQLPGVQSLLPVVRRRAVLRLFALAGLALALAAFDGRDLPARVAGALLLSAYLALGWTQAGLSRAVRGFAMAHPPR